MKWRAAIEVDFKQLLEDISYTNMIMKSFDVKHIITRNQYYQLKDRLVLWLLSHKFTKKTIDGFEYLVDKKGDKVGLIKLTLEFEDIKCLIHQNISSKILKMLNVSSFPKLDDLTDLYKPVHYNNIEYDEKKFKKAINRMKIVRIYFLREMMDYSTFESCASTNYASKDPWMKKYRKYLPWAGTVDIVIVYHSRFEKSFYNND